MNCHDFEYIVGDLARDHLMVADQREKALAHSASCAKCAARLSDERTLTEGLRLLARMDAQAPARVEAALLTAFRDQKTKGRSISFNAATRRNWKYAAAVAAVALIVTLLAFATRDRESQKPMPEKATKETPAAPSAPNNPAPAIPIPSAPDKRQESVVVPAIANKSAAKSRNALAMNRVGSQHRDSKNEKDKLNENEEIATEFIPLMNREALSQMDGGQVMRVELPRSALMSFGLPMDMERATERIKADVVVGNDGLARAIRFVR